MKNYLYLLFAIAICIFISLHFISADIVITIPDSYSKIEPGEELLASIKLLNIGSKRRIDVILNYEIKNNGETLIEKSETVAVETQANFVRTFDIPKDAPEGAYKLYAKLIYSDGTEASAESSFQVISKKQEKLKYYAFASIAAVFAMIVYFAAFKSKDILEKIKLRMKVHKIVKKRIGEK